MNCAQFPEQTVRSFAFLRSLVGVQKAQRRIKEESEEPPLGIYRCIFSDGSKLEGHQSNSLQRPGHSLDVRGQLRQGRTSAATLQAAAPTGPPAVCLGCGTWVLALTSQS